MAASTLWLPTLPSFSDLEVENASFGRVGVVALCTSNVGSGFGVNVYDWPLYLLPLLSPETGEEVACS